MIYYGFIILSPYSYFSADFCTPCCFLPVRMRTRLKSRHYPNPVTLTHLNGWLTPTLKNLPGHQLLLLRACFGCIIFGVMKSDIDYRGDCSPAQSSNPQVLIRRFSVGSL